jgi:hypothetical protein
MIRGGLHMNKIKTRKITAYIITFIILVQLTGAYFCTIVKAEQVGNSAETYAVKTKGNYQYEVNEDKKTVKIVKYTGKAENLTIPNKIAGKKVTIIGGDAFAECNTLKSIKISEGIETIEFLAFENCKNLKQIEISSTVKEIQWCSSGGNPFAGCSKLEKIDVSSKNKVFNSKNGCNAIIETKEKVLRTGCKNTKIPSNIVYIGDGAFYGCIGLKTINIPSKVEHIGSWAFYGCKNLTKVVLPDSVQVIDYYAFEYCNKLSSIKMPSSLLWIGAFAFKGDKNLKSIKLPSGVEEIYGYAFEDCSKLTSITIPKSVTFIGIGAFHNCKNIKRVVIKTKNIKRMDSDAFLKINKNAKIYVPKGKKKEYKKLFVENDVGYKKTMKIIELK